jgi:hypothetical protein
MFGENHLLGMGSMEVMMMFIHPVVKHGGGGCLYNSVLERFVIFFQCRINYIEVKYLINIILICGRILVGVFFFCLFISVLF